MTNKFRGEISIEVGGKTYPIAITLDAIGRLATVYQLETIAEIEKRLLEFRATDAVDTLEALLASNGHAVDRAEIGRVEPMAYGRAIAALYTRPAPKEGADAGPPKRGKPSAPAST